MPSNTNGPSSRRRPDTLGELPAAVAVVASRSGPHPRTPETTASRSSVPWTVAPTSPGTNPMPEYSFTLIFEGEPDLDALYEAGCDDALIGEVDGVHYADFDREAPSLAEAVLSAISAVESAGPRALRVEPDDLVTAAEIAERLGRTRESVRLLIAGERGSGDFPAPVSHLRSRNRLWRWSDAAAWAGRLTPGEEHDARLLAAVNGALELRRQREALSGEERRALEALAH